MKCKFGGHISSEVTRDNEFTKIKYVWSVSSSDGVGGIAVWRDFSGTLGVAEGKVVKVSQVCGPTVVVLVCLPIEVGEFANELVA